jgi:hypothetical protein
LFRAARRYKELKEILVYFYDASSAAFFRASFSF